MRTKQPVTDPATPMSEPIPITSVRKRAAARGRTAASGDAPSAAVGALEKDAAAGPTKRAPKATPTRAEIVAASRAERAALEVARKAVDVAEDKKAADIVLLDLAGVTTMADYFVICSGGSERQIQAIADGIVDALRAEGVRPIGREGEAASHWILVDFGAVIVHVFTPPERDYYELEKHWSEARTILRVQ
jgi:ribosome-associated protein